MSISSVTTRGRGGQTVRGPGARTDPECPASVPRNTIHDQQQTPTAPQQHPPSEGLSGCHIIPPNEVRRNKLLSIARKELEDLERYKETHKPSPIKMDPTKLGGNVSEYEARKQQQLSLQQSKYQQQLKREEYKRRQKEEEEAELQKMKTIQREKAIQLEEKKKQQEKQRRQMFEEDRHQKNSALLNKLDVSPSYGGFCQIGSFDEESDSWGQESSCWGHESKTAMQEPNAWARNHSYIQAQKEEEKRKLQQMKEEQHRKSELLEFKRKQDEKDKMKTRQSEQRRVNNAFLDRLESATLPQALHRTDRFENTHSAFGYSYNRANR
ncbi:epithelial-stromal interaction protein 1 [Ambystoma mexicanum]|uniref:epithelial-stromal interaction protein 1 n=1 Tax=Ambystoma mexicanum TaxID=8296 RepID=UPI0037E72BF2